MELLFIAFIIKHFICDFPLQVPFMFLNKGRYGHFGGISHAAIHGLGTWIIQIIFTGNPFAPFFLVDIIIHYHVDWAKNQINDRYKLNPANKYFWWLLGADQLAHYLTYALLAGLII